MSLSRMSARTDEAGPMSDFPRTVRKSPTLGRRSSRAVPCLATVPPRDQNSKRNVKPPKRRSHDPVVPRRWGEEGKRSCQHEADAHDGNDSDGKRAASHDARAVEEEP